MGLPGSLPFGLPGDIESSTGVSTAVPPNPLAFGSGESAPAVPPFRDFLIDVLTDDLVFAEGDLVAATDVVNALVATAQEISIALKTLQGEWFLDLDKGTPWQSIFGKGADLPAARESIRQIIASCSTVTDVPVLVLSLDRVARQLSITGVASTAAGPVDFSTEVP